MVYTVYIWYNNDNNTIWQYIVGVAAEDEQRTEEDAQHAAEMN